MVEMRVEYNGYSRDIEEVMRDVDGNLHGLRYENDMLKSRIEQLEHDMETFKKVFDWMKIQSNDSSDSTSSQ